MLMEYAPSGTTSMMDHGWEATRIDIMHPRRQAIIP